MVADGKIAVEEAEKLLVALAAEESSSPAEKEKGSRGKTNLKYLRVLVEPAPDSKNSDRVNIRVPMNLIRAGLKWAAFIPKHAQEKVNEALKEKGIDVDFDKMKPEDLEEIIMNLNDLQVEVEGEETVKIYCE